MRRTGFIALIAVMVLTMLAACGGNSNNNDNASGNDASPSASASPSESPSPSEKPSEPIKLTYMTWDYADRTASTDAWIKDMKDKFNIEIEMQNLPTDNYTNLLKTKLAADDLPDLVKIHGVGRDGSLYNSEMDPDLFYDLQNLSVIQDYVPNIVQDTLRNGKLYYMPVSTSALGAIYNKKIFADLGLQEPTNIEEMVDVLEKIKASGIPPIAGSFKDSWTAQILPFIAFSQYVDVKDKDMWKKLRAGDAKYSDIAEDVKKVLDLQLEWADKGYISKDFLGTDANVAAAMVATGKAAMIINGTWQYKAVQDGDPNAEIGFMAVPLNQPGEPMAVATSSGEGIAINSKSKNLEAAKQALEYYLSAENQTRVITEIKGIPINTKVQVDDPFVNQVSEVLAGGEVLPLWWGGDYFPPGSNVDMAKDLQAHIAGALSSEQLIEQYDKEAARALAENQ